MLARLFKLAALVLDFVKQSHVLDGNRAWSAKVVTNSICLSVNGCTSERVKANTRSECPRAASEHQRAVRKTPNLGRLSQRCTLDQTLHRRYEPRDLRLKRVLRLILVRALTGTLRHVIPDLPGMAVGLSGVEPSFLLANNDGLIGIAKSDRPIQRASCSTVRRSKVERLMTLSTSAVAVCCLQRLG